MFSRKVIFPNLIKQINSQIFPSPFHPHHRLPWGLDCEDWDKEKVTVQNIYRLQEGRNHAKHSLTMIVIVLELGCLKLIKDSRVFLVTQAIKPV